MSLVMEVTGERIVSRTIRLRNEREKGVGWHVV